MTEGSPLKRLVTRCQWCRKRFRSRRFVPLGKIATCSKECRASWIEYVSSDVTEEEVDRCLERLAAEIPPTGDTAKRARFLR